MQQEKTMQRQRHLIGLILCLAVAGCGQVTLPPQPDAAVDSAVIDAVAIDSAAPDGGGPTLAEYWDVTWTCHSKLECSPDVTRWDELRIRAGVVAIDCSANPCGEVYFVYSLQDGCLVLSDPSGFSWGDIVQVPVVLCFDESTLTGDWVIDGHPWGMVARPR